MTRIYDRTAQHAQEEAALLQAKPRFNWNPLSYLWTGWELFAFFFAPPNGCQYCWVLRMFLLGVLVGLYIGHFFPWVRLW